MKFTNKHNLPQYIVDWLLHDDYDYADDPLHISATTLMKPVRATLIPIRHHENLETDVLDLIAARLGSAIHDSIERIDTPGVTKETRVSREVLIDDVVYTVTGKFDILTEEEDGFRLRDIKTTSVWAYIYGGKDEDYRRQLSIYRWLLSPDYQVKDIGYIDFMFTDWQASKAKQDSSYPQSRIRMGYKISLMTLEETENYVRERLELIHANKDVVDDDLPHCTNKELWATPEKFAVMKNGNKRATKLCDSQQEAEQYMSAKNIAGYIQHRPAKVKRCKYCAAAPFCSQFKYFAENKLVDGA